MPRRSNPTRGESKNKNSYQYQVMLLLLPRDATPPTRGTPRAARSESGVDWGLTSSSEGPEETSPSSRTLAAILASADAGGGGGWGWEGDGELGFGAAAGRGPDMGGRGGGA